MKLTALLAAAGIAVSGMCAQASTVNVTTVVTPNIVTFPGYTGILDLSVVDITTLTEGIIEVNLAGVGLFSYPDLVSGPDPLDTATAISDALAFFALSGATPVLSSVLLALTPVTTTTTQLQVTEDPGTVWIGDATNCTVGPGSITLVVVGRLNCITTNTIDIDQGYRLDVTLGQLAPVPLPAAGWLLAAALAGLGLLARTRRA